MDVKTQFKNRELAVVIYMQKATGLVDSENLSKVCRQQKSLVGQKQASRSWNQKFNSSPIKFGFSRGDADSCVYYSENWNDVLDNGLQYQARYYLRPPLLPSHGATSLL